MAIAWAALLMKGTALIRNASNPMLITHTTNQPIRLAPDPWLGAAAGFCIMSLSSLCLKILPLTPTHTFCKAVHIAPPGAALPQARQPCPADFCERGVPGAGPGPGHGPNNRGCRDTDLAARTTHPNDVEGRA